jgi:glycine/D-amino acid oxidase-like deaminating enzyme
VASGYSGSGVSFATQAGMRLAELIAGRRKDHPVPLVGRRAPRFPLAPLRRTGQRLFYAGWRALDERS